MPASNDPHAALQRQAFGLRLRSLREERGLSQETFANAARVHRTYLSSVERGQRNVSLDIIMRLADALDLPAAQLFEGLQ